MTISQDDAARLKELQISIQEQLEEFKTICRQSMTAQEYDMFRYRTLGHIEPVVFEGSDWVTTYSSLDSLEKVAEQAIGDAEDENDDEDDDDKFTPSNLTLADVVVGQSYNVQKKDTADLFDHSFVGTAKEVNAAYVIVEDQEGDCFTVDADQLTPATD